MSITATPKKKDLNLKSKDITLNNLKVYRDDQFSRQKAYKISGLTLDIETRNNEKSVGTIELYGYPGCCGLMVLTNFRFYPYYTKYIQTTETLVKIITSCIQQYDPSLSYLYTVATSVENYSCNNCDCDDYEYCKAGDPAEASLEAELLNAAFKKLGWKLIDVRENESSKNTLHTWISPKQ